nr:MAG TPA: hypothetical protein [Caudoviricetes sp.]
MFERFVQLHYAESKLCKLYKIMLSASARGCAKQPRRFLKGGCAI